MSDSWHSYPSVHALGHRYLEGLFDGNVIIEEKIDGSQYSAGVFDGELRVRSKGQELVIDAPEKMFARAVESTKELAPRMRDGWTYRFEYLQSPKHNVLAYSRVPEKHLILFDVNVGLESYLPYDRKYEEAQRLGIECVPLVGGGSNVDWSPEYLLSLLDRESVLGGQKIEGIVVKNYDRYGLDKKILIGKYVSEAFKEVHAGEWKRANPTSKDIVQSIITSYRTDARWRKAVQHLREAGNIEGSPRDIGKLIVETKADLRKEEEEAVKDILFTHFWPQIERGAVAGLAEWYKQVLLEQQFEAK